MLRLFLKTENPWFQTAGLTKAMPGGRSYEERTLRHIKSLRKEYHDRKHRLLQDGFPVTEKTFLALATFMAARYHVDISNFTDFD